MATMRFPDAGIVLQLVNSCQFDTVAFKLDRDAHLLAGIAATDVATSSSDTPGGIRRPNLVDYRAATFWQSHTLEPSQQLFVAKHEPSSEMTSFAILFFALILQRMDQSYSSFVHQFL